MANELHTVIYGSYTIPNLVGAYSLRKNGMDFEFSQEFLIDETSAAAFTTATQAAETALAKINLALTVTWEGQGDHYDFDPAVRASLLNRGEITKVSDMTWSGQQLRRYKFTCRGRLPASAADGGTDGNFEFSVTELRGANLIPTYTFEGEYTGEGAGNSAADLYGDATNGAKAKAIAWLKANASPVEDAGGTAADPVNYEIVDPVRLQMEDQGHVLKFALTYRYRNIPETAAGLRNKKFVIDSCVVTQDTREQIAAGGFGELPEIFGITFRIQVDRAQTSYDNLATLYRDEVRPFLVQHLETVMTAIAGNGNFTSSMYMLGESVSANTLGSVIESKWSVQAANTSGYVGVDANFRARKDLRLLVAKRGDGKEDSYDFMTPGRRVDGEQVVSALIVGQTYDLLSWEAALARFPEVGGPWKVLTEDMSSTPLRKRALSDAGLTMVRLIVRREYILTGDRPVVDPTVTGIGW